MPLACWAKAGPGVPTAETGLYVGVHHGHATVHPARAATGVHNSSNFGTIFPWAVNFFRAHLPLVLFQELPKVTYA